MAKAKWKAHPYADLFPMMTEEELEALAEDIRENGLRNPVVRYQDTVLDGRNRLLACERAGVDPRFENFEGSDEEAFALVESLNVQRRDLKTGQRALVAAKVWGLNGYSKGGRPEKGKPVEPRLVSLESISKRYKTSKDSVLQARDLLAEAPDLAAEVEHGAPLSTNYDTFRTRQKQIAEDRRMAQRAKEYEDAISSGELTLQAALKKITEDEQQREADLQARRIWFEKLIEAISWAEEWVLKRPDDRLRWIAEDESIGCPVSRKEVQKLVQAAEKTLELVVTEENERGKKKKGR